MKVKNDKMAQGEPVRVAGVHALVALLAASADTIAQSCEVCDRAARAGSALPPAGARLLDGYHLLDAQLRLARGRLRPAVSSIADGAARACQLMQDAVAHGDGRVEPDALASQLAAAQDSAPLGIAELDALPVLLRLALVARLARLAARAAAACTARAQAGSWAERLVDTAEARPGDLVLLFADMARSADADNSSFVVELARRLQGRGAALAQVNDWLDARLADSGSSIARQMQDEQRQEALDAITAANGLASLRALGAVDWRAFAERLGAVDALLREDPDGSYARMDGATRDRYRHQVARLARAAGVAETTVAQDAIALAGVHRAPGEGGLDARTRHVGHYLAGPGLAALEARLQGRHGPMLRLRAMLQGGATGLCIGATATLTLLLTGAVLVHAWQGGAGALLLVLMGVLALPVAAGLARTLTTMAGCWLARPRVTPRLDVAAGLADDAQTVVAVSAMAADAAHLDALCDGLAQRYLGNRDPRLRFCLLLDLPDAASETLPADAPLLAAASAAIEALNRHHGGAPDGPFMLLVRARSWSIDQQAWIGRERRRGQLTDFNAWLCGERERFLLAAGNTGGAAAMRYVIALDADTGLPRDAARSLVAAIAHPLHQPVQDDGGRVLEGHGMLLPQVGSDLPQRGAMRFERLAPQACHGWAAIYDVDAWRRAVGNEVRDEGRAEPGAPEQDRLRAARVDDLRLLATHPGSYGEQTLRRHRSLRAAWQEARRMGRGATGLCNTEVRWDLFDRLAGSLVAPAAILLLVLCWSLLAAPVFWTAAVLAVIGLPALAEMLAALAARPGDAPLRQHLAAWTRSARETLVRAALALAFLPHTAWVDADAVARGLWRRDVSRRKLLELRPPALARSSRIMENNWRAMWCAPLLAVAVAVLLTFANPYALFATAPLLLLWFLSPVLAWWTSQPSRRGMRLARGQTRFLRALARRSWAFFEQHGVGAHGLAPEAVFDHPEPSTDARVSSAGIGLSLLATLSARDFGFVTLGGLLERSEAALASLDLLERWHGHPFQWYDGATLAALEPARVDTAANGSLVLSLRTFAAGLDELPERPIVDKAALDGIRTTLAVVREHAAPDARHAVDALDQALAPARWRATDTLPGLADCLRAAVAGATELATGLPEGADPALRAWVERLQRQCEAQLQDLCALAPWMRAAQEYVLDASLTRIPSLRELAALAPPATANAGLAQLVDEGSACARARLERLAALAAQARAAACMDFGLLVDPASGLLAAGYQVRDSRFDGDSCDLLASEARMASFAAVAQGQLPRQHWDALGRPLRMAGADALLLSRDGALADYLAPQLWMPSWRATLLDDAGRALVRQQAAWAKGKGVPWGFTESACNAVDAAARYRVRRFGLPAAALQRRANDDLAAAPHGAALALLVAPTLAAANLHRMAGQGLLGETGFHEALDFAPGRLPQGERQAVVRAQVSRHQAMTLLALAHHLHGQPMQRRFQRDPELRAALGLLQEPAPASGAEPPARYDAGMTDEGIAARPYVRVVRHNGAALPEVQLLSNGRYHLVQGSDGAAASYWDGMRLTRAAGMACHVRDTASGALWSTALLPALAPAERDEAVLAEGRVSFLRVGHGIEMRTDVVVAPGDDVELHRIRIVNRGSQARALELTSSVALAGPPPQDGARSNIKVEFDVSTDSLLCLTAPDAPVVVHRMTVRGPAGDASVETSRARFIGRGHDLRAPQAVCSGGALAGLDPEPDEALLALRRTVTLGPQQEITVDLVLGAASGRAAARALAARYGAGHAIDHAIEAAWTQAQAYLRRHEVGQADAQLYNRLAGCLLQPVPALRADPAVIARNARGRADLAPYGLDGGLPVLLLQLGDGPDTGLARQALQAHGYLRHHGLAIDLLVLCDSRAVREALMQLATLFVDPASFDQPGGLHLHLKEEVPREDRILLRSSASVLLAAERGDLADQLRRAERGAPSLPPPLRPATPAPAWSVEPQAPASSELSFGNGIGGFTPDGREYVVRAGAGLPAPSTPWVNLLANADFGSTVSERGHAVSWSGEGGIHLTAGQGDALAPQDGEAFYLRDEDSGVFWSPTPWPAPSPEPYTTRHGVGYSVFEHRAHGIHSELRCFVAQDGPLKYSVLRLRNDSDAPRRLSATGYVAWLLDDSGLAPGLQVVTGADLASGALLARNAFGAGFRDKVAFFHVDAEQVATTCDRHEFIGRQGDIAAPAALARAGLSGAAGAGFDPCAALQVGVTLAPGATRELVFVLGVAGPGNLDASAVVQRHGGAAAAAAAWQRLRDWWDDTLGAVTLQSPDPALDLRVNVWLPYQAISAMWGQADTATRLQSALACAYLRPGLLRAELLGAARAFTTDCVVEDFLWLPYALTRYLAATGDGSVLAAQPFEQDDAARLAARDDLYQHCVHGLRGCLRFGPRGLPPAAGRLHEEHHPSRVESIGLGFFMATVLQDFAEVADGRGDFGFATTCRGAALALRAQCEEHGWDGDWYRWTWLDSSNALGAIASVACRVELGTQCWALAADAAHGAHALRAAGQRLIGRDVALRCDPPVDGLWSERVAASPGQDHRVTAWAAAGFARLGDAARAWQLMHMLDPLARDGAAHAAAPYLMSGGVRAIEPHAGRATGGVHSTAPAWTWLAIVEALLGIERDGQRLRLTPHLAPGWDGFRLRYRHHGAIYEITVHAVSVGEGVLFDGQRCPDWTIVLQDDRRDHQVEVRVAGTPALPAGDQA